MTAHSWIRPTPAARVCRRCGLNERWVMGRGWVVVFAGVGTCTAESFEARLERAIDETATALERLRRRAEHPPPNAAPPALTPPRATWGEPRRVDEWWWLDLNEWSAPGVLKRCGRVSWNADGTDYYQISLSYEDIGLGLSCWPSFYALWAAQGYVEVLWALPLADVEALHGTQWPNVVL